MNPNIPYTAYEYGNGDSDEAVALVTGLDGDVDSLEQAAIDLERSGRDSVIYTYDSGVLLDGDATLIPNCINTIKSDFAKRTRNHITKRFGGVSLGGIIAGNMQKDYNSVERGLYAATGGSAANLVMRNYAFNALILATHKINLRKSYQKNGYTYDDLYEAWDEYQTPPTTPFTLALGGIDFVMRRRQVMSTMESYRDINPDIKTIIKPFYGHNQTINWYNTHINEMLEN